MNRSGFWFSRSFKFRSSWRFTHCWFTYEKIFSLFV